MTTTTAVPGAPVAPGQTFWPSSGPLDSGPARPAPVAIVPSQAGPAQRASSHGRQPTAQMSPAAPMPSLRAMGVDTRVLAAPREPVRTEVLRCSSAVLGAAQHLLEQPAPELGTVTRVVASDPVAALRVLHLANLATQRGYRADTIASAVGVLGPGTLANLVDELLLDASRRPMTGLTRVLTRALACEGLSGDPIAFTVGLLSGLAAELGVPADVLLDVAGVSREISDAVRFGTGPWGPVLAAVIAYERNDAMGVSRSGIAHVDVYDAHVSATADAMATAHAIAPT